jgi:hypothetical protein
VSSHPPLVVIPGSSGAARILPLFSRVFDCLAPVSPDTALSLVAQGFDCAARYVENLSVGERDGLWAAGLAILPLTEMTAGELSGTVGQQRADQTNAHLLRLGVPAGVHVMADLEATPANADLSHVHDYIDTLSHGIEAEHRPCLLYVGAGQPLNGRMLYMLPHVHLYWRGGSVGIPEPMCSFALWQLPPLDQTVSGHRVDVSMSGRDVRGRAPTAWWGS